MRYLTNALSNTAILSALTILGRNTVIYRLLSDVIHNLERLIDTRGKTTTSIQLMND
jgi:hypothetical protein